MTEPEFPHCFLGKTIEPFGIFLVATETIPFLSEEQSKIKARGFRI